MRTAEQPRRRDRTASEARILAAAWELFEEGRPLAGINLQAVADRAGVNRSLVYQYFGDRDGLVRAALADRVAKAAGLYAESRAMPFPERRKRIFEMSLVDPRASQILVQLVLAGDEEVRIFPLLEATQAALERDRAEGVLPAKADAVVMHAMTVICHLGYMAVRTRVAAELSIPLDELDRRAGAVFGDMVDGLIERTSARLSGRDD